MKLEGQAGPAARSRSIGSLFLVVLVIGALCFLPPFGHRLQPWEYSVVAQEPGATPAVSGSGLPPVSSADVTDTKLYKPGEILVKYRGDASAAATAGLAAEYDAVQKRTLLSGDVDVWRVPEGEEVAIAKQASADPRVEYAEPNYVYHAFYVPDDPYLNRQWAHTLLKSAAAWDISTGSSDTIIAIIDTGIDLTHPDLAGKIVNGIDLVDGGQPGDQNGHGTHVAGIAAAVTNNGTGVAGMDWQARIMPVRVLGADGSGYVSDVAAGITWAYQHGARVLNLSLGGSAASQTLRDAVNAASAAGSLVVAAMGNCRTYDPPACPVANLTMYPAAYDNVVAVAATGPTDGYAYYSQYGPHCDIAAPGGEMGGYHDIDGIYSTMPTYPVFLTTNYSYSRTYDFLQGTSQATPYVAGLAALLWAVDPDLTPGEVRNLLLATADDLGIAGWDYDYGYGRINALAALQAVSVPMAPTLFPIENSDADGNYLVDWKTVANAAGGYTLQEDDQPTFNSPTERYRGAASQFQVTGQAGGTWYYRVRASNAAGTSVWSTTRSANVAPSAPILQPIANPGKGDEYELIWAASASATGYTLEEANSPAFTQATVRYSGPALRYRVTGQPGGDWYYRIRATSPAGTGPWSTVRSTQVNPSPLEAPLLQAIANADGDPNYLVRWGSVPGAGTYILEQSADPYFGVPVQVASVASLQFEVVDQPGGTWHYRVRAVGNDGRSPWSNSRSVVVLVRAHLPFLVRNLGSSSPGGALQNGDFESGRVGWAESSTNGLPIILDSFPFYVAAHSGSWAAWLGGEDDEISYIEQQITVPNGKTYLTYWHWIDSEDFCGSAAVHYDVAGVVVDGAVVDLYGLCFIKNTASWAQHVVNLSSFAGQPVSFRIEVKTDSSLNSNLFVDDVSFQDSSARIVNKEPASIIGGPEGTVPGHAQPKPN